MLSPNLAPTLTVSPSATQDTSVATAPAASDPRWLAVTRRDSGEDGEFVYAVITTGVYCRPSCGSRAAKRENVRLFDTTLHARAAGFRACKRCHPDGAALQQRQSALIAEACAAMAASDTPLTLATLAAKAGLSPFHFQRVFKAAAGVTPKDYQKALRRKLTVGALGSAGSVTEAIYEAGYNSAGHFYQDAGAELGMPPSTFRKGGAGLTIRYALAQSPLGTVLIAAAARGICAIELGDSSTDLETALQVRFPKAQLQPAGRAFEAWVNTVIAYLDQPKGSLDLPLDVQGTAFQRQVWQALRRIPAGNTASYAEVAAAIGAPSAARAVAQACASNPAAVAIPCHRVVRSDGSISGYRWGVARKTTLLRRESEAANGAGD